MKREEKNQLSRQKILENAMKEFGEQGYGLSSINTICSAGGISKGILYHYFTDKDELYLACVRETFEKLTEALREEGLLEVKDIEDGMRRYFDVRLAFFREHPYCHRIFCETVTAPPQQLREEIGGIKSGFDSLNITVFTSLLRNARLCAGTTLDEVVEIFRTYQDFAAVRYQMSVADGIAPEKYEQICERAVHVLLYGVIDRGGEAL